MNANKHDIDDMNAIVSSICESRKKMDEISINSVFRWIDDMQNDALSNLIFVQTFIENNIDVFLKPGLKWENRSSNSEMGESNPMNSVIRQYIGVGGRTVAAWLDKINGGLYFRYNTSKKKVVYVSVSYPNTARPTFQSAYDFYWFKSFTGMSEEQGFEQFFPLKPVTKDELTTFEKIEEFTNKVKADYKLSLDVLSALKASLRKISEDEEKYLERKRSIVRESLDMDP